MSRTMSLHTLDNIPAIAPGDDLGDVIGDALKATDAADGDVLVVAQKIISKSENRYASLSDVAPTDQALLLTGQTGKDPRFVQLVLDESLAVVRTAPNVLITTHRSGHTAANAGIDQSNVDQCEKGDRVLLLPEDADASAKKLRAALKARCGIDLSVIISDSFGRPWRVGTVGFAIGCAGLEPVEDQCGDTDLNGRVLEATFIARADELAAAACVLMGQGAEGTPVVLIKGAPIRRGEATSRALLRDMKEDLFR